MSKLEVPALEPLADGTGFRVRIRYGKGRRNRFRIPSTDEEFAAKRRDVLVDLGAQLATAPKDLAEQLLTQAGAADGAGLARVRAFVEKLASDGARVKRKADNPRERWTVRELGEAWTDGTLAKDFPGRVKALRSHRENISRLERHVYPVIGEIPVRTLTLEQCERVVDRATAKRRGRRTALAANTRRHIGLLLHRLLTLAAYPLKIIPANPLPRGFLPHAGKPKAFSYLYPDEDLRLMRCKSIPIEERAFWGFLTREGCRDASEALGLTWKDFDLKRGIVRLDKNKTDDPRAWPLSPGVANALAKLRPRRVEASALVFPQPPDPNALARNLRRRLEEAGIDRPELFESTPERQALRAHDLRGSFVTVALANGKTEAWVADRTGHQSSVMIAKYRRAARTVAEAKGLGDWTPLDVALGLTRAKGASRKSVLGGTARGTDKRARRDSNP